MRTDHASLGEMQGSALDVTMLDHVVVLRGVSWETYLRLGEDRHGNTWPRLAYLDGVLEIMSPTGIEHELRKKLLARFLEGYAGVRGIALNGFGNATFANQLEQAGLEPDECYCIGDAEDLPSEPPHLALEVSFTSGGVDKLEIYRRLGVREVWFWIDDALAIYALGDRGYEERAASALFPELGMTDLALRVRTTDRNHQTRAVEAYRALLRGE